MSDALPSVTVIIAAPPDMAEIKAVASARGLDYPADRFEILVARGRQPSVQRNTAMRVATGDLIYFLDDDSSVPADLLRRAVQHFTKPHVEIVGGPNVCPPDAPELEQIFALVLGSWLAFGPSRARYTPVGRTRESGEKELILCNMLAHRETMLKHGGFNEALYPNEENALMDEIQKAGGKLLYDPELWIHRRPRRSIKSFVRMLLNYGRGRAEQFRLHPTPGSFLNFVPPLFCLYLLGLPLIWLVKFTPAHWYVPQYYTLLLALYALSLLGELAVLVIPGGIRRAILAMPFIVLTHVIYGVGFLRGLFTRLKPAGMPAKTPVTLETVTR